MSNNKQDKKDIEHKQPEAPNQEQQPTSEQSEAAERTARIEALEAEVADLKDQMLRKIAEFDNFRKRTYKEKEAIYPKAQADAVEKFIPTIDAFERALACECSDKEFGKGVDMIYAAFTDAMKLCGVEEIGGEGQPFNPNLHNAVMHEDDPDKGESTVTQVLQKGYKIGDKIIRYAMVKVAN